MLYINLVKAIHNRGFQNPNSFLIKAGFTYYTASRILNNIKGGLSYTDLEKICIALNCTPNDIFAWQPPANANIPADHPLQKLKPKEEGPTIQQQLQHLPQDKLDEVKKFISSLVENKD